MSVPDIQHVLDLLKEREMDAAIAELEAKVREIPAHLTAHVLLARAYESKQRWDDALKAWENAHFLMPNSPTIGKGKERVLGKMSASSGDGAAESSLQQAAPAPPSTSSRDASDETASPDRTEPATGDETVQEKTSEAETSENATPEDATSEIETSENATTDEAEEASAPEALSPPRDAAADSRQGSVPPTSKDAREEPTAEEPTAEESTAEESTAEEDAEESTGPDTASLAQELMPTNMRRPPSTEELEAARSRKSTSEPTETTGDPKPEDAEAEDTSAQDASAQDAATDDAAKGDASKGDAASEDAKGASSSGPPTTASQALSELDKLRKRAEQEARSGGSRRGLAAQQEMQERAEQQSDASDDDDTRDDPVTGDLDRLINELESARFEPRPDPDDVPEPDLDDDVDDLVSETLARIYAAQDQYREAARIYVKLAAQEPGRARYFLQNASDMREKAEAKEAKEAEEAKMDDD